MSFAAIPKTTFGPIKFRIKQNDTQPSITYVTVDENQQMVPITGATGVQFRYCPQGAPISQAITRNAVIVDAANGQVRYDWSISDTIVAGNYNAEWIVTFLGGGQRTFPVRGFSPFVVEANL